MRRDQNKEKYLSSVAYFRLLESKEERLLLVLSLLRLLTFIAGFFIIWLGFKISALAGIVLLLLDIFLFFFFLKLYSSHLEKKEFLNNLALINQNEADAVSGDFSGFKSGTSYTDTGHDFSNDLDLFGEASLFQYLNRTVTGYGQDILADWLSDPFAISSELILRQEAIKELSRKENWRHVFLASGMRKELEKREISGLLKWLEESSLTKYSGIIKIVDYLLPAAALISLLLLTAGILHYSYFTFIFLSNLLYISAGLKKSNKIHAVLTSRYNYLSSMNGLLKTFENEEFSSEILTRIKMNISGEKSSAALSVRKLGHLIQAFDTRLNIIVSIVLNGLLLWDYHIIYQLEKWKTENRKFFPGWLEMLGQADAFVSLGNYAYNNPDFTYPVLSDKSPVFSSGNMGHPLIDEDKRVCNDFTVEQYGTIFIVSGANMAGKSTFLRTLAVNYLLGMTGAPVCAAQMSFIPLKLFTSMRTSDSLSNNESYFYAELKRLKLLKSRIENGEILLFILDEILKGTNSADKSLGSKLFLKRLVELGATGLIATHDTSLGVMENEYPGLIFNKCFEIEIDGEIIKFDYKLQNGVTQKMNAALLMKQMGILD
jgi:DNA mismatch repair ATPase MutS